MVWLSGIFVDLLAVVEASCGVLAVGIVATCNVVSCTGINGWVADVLTVIGCVVVCVVVEFNAMVAGCNVVVVGNAVITTFVVKCAGLTVCGKVAMASEIVTTGIGVVVVAGIEVVVGVGVVVVAGDVVVVATGVEVTFPVWFKASPFSLGSDVGTCKQKAKNLVNHSDIITTGN